MPLASADVAAYVPARVLELLPSTAIVPAARELPGAVLVTDIQGFTPIADRLVREGAPGVERLSELLNAFYAELFEQVDAHGGEVITIVGDGVISLWPAQREHQLEVALENALSCAIRISRELHGKRPDGVTPLSVRTGVGVGPLSIVRLGNEDRWELVLLGDAVVQACSAERHAVPGTVAVAEPTAQRLGSLARCRAIGPRYYEVIEAFGPARASATRIKGSIESDNFRRYLAPPVRACLDAGASRWLAELRNVTAVFVHLPTQGNSVLEPEPLQRALAELQVVVSHYQGTFDKLVLDDKGLVATFVFGLPPHAHENDAERAVLAGFDAIDRLSRHKLPVDVGIATGRVFWGPIGSQARRQYCLVGSVMSLGARIMQHARGEVLCCPETQAAVRGYITWELAGQHSLKGFPGATALHRPRLTRLPLSRRQRMRAVHGRTSERAELAPAVARAARGEGGTVLIEAHAGAGKTVLIEALYGLARRGRVRTLTVTGNAIEQSMPYLAFRDAMLDLLWLSPREEPEPAFIAREIAAHVDGLPGMAGLAPLLGGLLGVAMRDTPQTEPLEGVLRADRIADLVLALLESFGQNGLVLVIEDLHWLDSASLRLVREVQRRVPSVALVMTSRPIASMSEELHALRERVQLRIELAPLPARDISSIVADRLGALRVAPQALALIVERSAGNPLFAESLAMSLVRHGLLMVRDTEIVLVPGANWHEERVPSSLDAVIGARIDALPTPMDLATLKAAAVLGPTFDLAILELVHPEAPPRESLLTSLGVLREHGLVVSLGGDELSFDHAVTQEVTYARLPLGQRRELHERAARAYEQAREAHAQSRLAHHYERAHDWYNACTALDGAALEASRSGAFREAARFLDRGLAILARNPELSERDPLRHVRWYRLLGEAHDALGNKDQMGRHARAALERLGVAPPATLSTRAVSVLAGALHELASRRGFSLAGLALRGLTLGGASLGADQAFEATRAAQTLAAHHYYALEPMAMVQNILFATRAAERAGSVGERAKCYSGVAMLLGLLGHHALARDYVARALAAGDETNDPQAATRAFVMSALCCVGAGDFAATEDIVQRAQDVADARNDHWSYCEAQAIRTWSHIYRGSFAVLPAEIAKLRERARRADHGHLSAWALRFEASEHSNAGRYEEAIAGFRAVLPVVSAQGDYPERLLVLGSLSLALLRSGEIDAARLIADEACTMLARHGRPTSHIMVQGVCDLLEALVTFVVTAPRASRSIASSKARAVLKVLAQCAKSFPVAGARYAIFRGTLQVLDDDLSKARRTFEAGLKVADRLGLRHDRAVLELAVLGQALSPELRRIARGGL
jgi:class 3 adenylate cyclase/tetratricopeptide (TPR) repeat protein